MTERPSLAVGFAGLGRMGTQMALRVLGAGLPLTVWNRSPERLDALTSAGARAAETPKALAEESEIVMTMVSDADALRSVLRGDEGVLAGLRPGSILIDTSTIGSAAAVELAAEVTERGAHWIDSPVSGSTALAEKGELTLMLGGEADAIERAAPVFDAISRQRFHLGGAGAGAAMKLAVQAVLAVLERGRRGGARARRARRNRP